MRQRSTLPACSLSTKSPSSRSPRLMSSRCPSGANCPPEGKIRLVVYSAEGLAAGRGLAAAAKARQDELVAQGGMLFGVQSRRAASAVLNGESYRADA